MDSDSIPRPQIRNMQLYGLRAPEIDAYGRPVEYAGIKDRLTHVGIGAKPSWASPVPRGPDRSKQIEHEIIEKR